MSISIETLLWLLGRYGRSALTQDEWFRVLQHLVPVGTPPGPLDDPKLMPPISIAFEPQPLS
jgi:hypothetical protein